MKLLQIRAEDPLAADLDLGSRIDEPLASLPVQTETDDSQVTRNGDDRATVMTQVMEEILRNRGQSMRPPMHWGLNE
jgi:hypothetical protein